MRFVWADHGSPDYWKAVELRRLVLRVPLGLDFTDEELEAEAGQKTLLAFDSEGALSGCLVLKPLDAGTVQMRQVATHPEYQGRGVGREMVYESERWARENGFTRMYLHARKVVVGFYERLGYLVWSEEYEEVGIPHLSMEKPLV